MEPDEMLEMEYEERVAPTLDDDDWDLYDLGVCTDNPPDDDHDEE
jgi:hypothetical protein